MVGRRWACRRGLAHKQGDCVETLDTFPYEQLLDNGLVDRVDRNRAVLPRVTANLLERGRNGELDVPVVACQYPIGALGVDLANASQSYDLTAFRRLGFRKTDDERVTFTNLPAILYSLRILVGPSFDIRILRAPRLRYEPRTHLVFSHSGLLTKARYATRRHATRFVLLCAVPGSSAFALLDNVTALKQFID